MKFDLSILVPNIFDETVTEYCHSFFMFLIEKTTDAQNKIIICEE